MRIGNLLKAGHKVEDNLYFNGGIKMKTHSISSGIGGFLLMFIGILLCFLSIDTLVDIKNSAIVNATVVNVKEYEVKDSDGGIITYKRYEYEVGYEYQGKMYNPSWRGFSESDYTKIKAYINPENPQEFICTYAERRLKIIENFFGFFIAIFFVIKGINVVKS